MDIDVTRHGDEAENGNRDDGVLEGPSSEELKNLSIPGEFTVVMKECCKSEVQEEEILLDPDEEAAIEREQHAAKKNSKVFPPPISWYNASAAGSRPGMFAYFGFNCLVIAKVVDGRKDTDMEVDRVWPVFSLITQQANFRCLSVSQQEWNHFAVKDSPIVTGDEKGHVRIWNVNEKMCVVYHTAHKEAKVVAGVEWSPRDPNLIYSIDDKGGLVVWKLKERTIRQMQLETSWRLSCLAVSPHEDHIIAVGALPGNILIVDVAKDPVTLHKMHHDEELVALRWAPTMNYDVVALDSHHIPPLLISAVNTINEPNIRVWDRVGNDVTILSLIEKEETLPGPFPVTGRKFPKIFVPTAWIRDPMSGKSVLFSCVNNKTICWKSDASNELVFPLPSTGGVFVMVQTGDILWSFGRDSMIFGWNLLENKEHMIIPLVKGVCCVQESSVLRTEVGLGCVDGIMRVISMRDGYPNNSTDCAPVQTFNMEAKVSAIAWHPLRDNLIGLGTSDGLLGIFKYEDGNKHVKRFEKRARGTVYGLDWGPAVYKYEEKIGLNTKDADAKEGNTNLVMYICADERILFINPNAVKSTPVNIFHIIRDSNPNSVNRGTTKMTDLRWCPDWKFFCIGYWDGRIEIYTPPYLALRCVIQCHKGAIQCLRWRPYDFDIASVSMSKWLASASNDGTVQLYNLAELYTREMKDGMIVSIRSSGKVLKGHEGIRVVSIAWSYFDPKLLVSVSYDQTAVVWNVMEEVPIARYCGHTQRLVACLFHPSDPFGVISMSDELRSDFSVHTWDYREHPYMDLSHEMIKKVKSRRKTLLIERETKKQEPLRLEKFIVVNEAVTTCSGDELSPDGSPSHDTEQGSVQTSLMPVSDSYLQDISTKVPELLSKMEGDVKGDPSPAIKKILDALCLGSAMDCKKLVVHDEIESHVRNGNWKQALILASYTGDSVKVVESALKEQHITMDVVNHVLCGSFSVPFRIRVMEAYAQKLKAQGQFHEACSFLVKIGQEMEAVQLFCQQKMYRDALLLTKLRFRGEQLRKVTHDILEEWATELMNTGNHFLLLLLRRTTRECKEALEVLDHWNMPDAWRVGIKISKCMDDFDRAYDFGMKFVDHALTKGSHGDCKTLLHEFPFLQWLEPVIGIHECLWKLQSGFDVDEEELLLVKSKVSQRPCDDFCGHTRNSVTAFIPQTKDEALLMLAKLMDGPVNVASELREKIHEKCEELNRRWFNSDAKISDLLTIYFTVSPQG